MNHLRTIGEAVVLSACLWAFGYFFTTIYFLLH